MNDNPETEYSDTLESDIEVKSSSRVLAAVKKSQDAFRDYQDTCDRIDDVYNQDISSDGNWLDPQYDLFWASMEIIKPATYAKAPQPAVAPMFADTSPLKNTTAELLERVSVAAFDRTGIDGVMQGVRDDLSFTNRGAMWVTYESHDGQKACIEHLDRKDFGHEPARQWEDVGYVWRRAWMTRKEMRKRFRKTSGDAYQTAQFAIRREDKNNGAADDSKKAGVYEVWHKADNRVYWVTEGVPVMLDEGAPHLKLKDFFPCPKPAFGTTRRRSLIPIPDYVRYAPHLAQINRLTARIYLLLDRVRMVGLIPAGGDIGDAVQAAMTSDDDELLIGVPAAAFAAGGAGGFVSWLPIAEVATAIQGLIQARAQLFEDFYQLSGISDIMRGATEAEETLGAQQLKSQYGSVRVRQKIDELQRIAADAARIVAEIASDKFTKETILDMGQMEIPTKADIKKQVEAIEKAAEQEMKSLANQAKQAAQKAQQSGEQVDPDQAKQAFAQAQSQILAKYGPQIKQASGQVSIEAVMDLLRDDKARGFAFEIATDSTIMTDEMQEKASRNEFFQVFTGSSQSVMGLAAMGEAGAALAGGLMKFLLAPYRVGRELNKLVDDFVDAAPEMAAQMNGQGAPEGQAELIAAQNKLAEAEIMKAQAQTQKVSADAQGKMQELQLRAAEAQAKAQSEQQKLALELEKSKATIAETEARIQKIFAEIEKLGVGTQIDVAKVQNETRKTDMEEVRTVSDIQARQVDQAMSAEDRQRQAVESERNAQMSERQQSFSEQQGERAESRADRQQHFSEQSADRQMTLAEKQAMQEPAE